MMLRLSINLLIIIIFNIVMRSSLCEPETPIDKIHLMRHSIGFGGNMNHEDWITDGDIMLYGQRIVLSAGPSTRSSRLWSRSAILTDTFEVEFSVQLQIAHPVDSSKPQESVWTEGFAVWYSPMSFTHATGLFPQPTDWSFFGHLNRFTGLGIFFRTTERSGKLTPSISAVYADGNRTWNVVNDTPTNSGVYWQILTSGDVLVFKLSVKPGHVSGQARTASTSKWTDTFSLDANVPVGGYLGFTANPAIKEATNNDRLTIWDVKSFNLNLNMQGEEPSYYTKEIAENLDKINKGEKDVGETLTRIAHALMKLSAEVIPKQNEMTRALEMIEARLSDLTVDLERIQERLGVRHHQHEALEGLTSQLSGLKQMFDSHTKNQAKATQTLLDAGRSLTEKGEKISGRRLDSIHVQLSKQSRVNYAMFGFVVFCVLSAVGYIWKKTKEIEKRHLF